MRIAILDIGTNTFHLLIADISKDKKIEILYKTEKFVKLGEEGINHIGEAAFRRGIELLKEYRKTINEFSPQKIYAFGTAALRRADNAEIFIRSAQEEAKIEIHRISGNEEAELICFGVRQAIPKQPSPFFIMDIGGGSTEFILCDNEKIFWKESFPLGASVLRQQFHHLEPIPKMEIKELNLYLEKTLQPLFSIKNKFSAANTLVGASGSFDSFASMVIEEFHPEDRIRSRKLLSIQAGRVAANPEKNAAAKPCRKIGYARSACFQGRNDHCGCRTDGIRNSEIRNQKNYSIRLRT